MQNISFIRSDLLAQVLNVPKSNIYIVRGEKAHYKTISVTDYATKTENDDDELSLIKALLLENADTSKSVLPPRIP